MGISLDAVAGSVFELKEAETIRARFEGLGADTRLYSVDVALWEHGECVVEGVRCVPIPPTVGGDVEGVLASDIDKCEDRILISSTTSFPDNMWNIYNEAIERGARAVIFYDYYPDRFRKIVVTGVWGYGYNQRSSARIPAIHVKLKDGIELLRRKLGKKIYIETMSSIRLSRGITIEGLIRGRKEGSILVSAHHDRWFNSYRDNVVAVKTLIEIAFQASRLGTPLHDIRLVSFTAEELGDPAMPAWYWGYGSRMYVREVDPRDILLAIVLDTAFREPIRVSTTSPDHVGALFMKTSLDIRFEGYGHPYTDAPSLWKAGIPTITLHNLEDLYPIYHTNLDIEDQPPRFLSILGRMLYIKLRDFEPENVRAISILEDLRERMPGEVFTNTIEKVSRNAEYKLIRCINMHTMRPIYIGSYREMYRDMHVDPFPYYIAYRASREGLREEVRIPGEEAILYSGEGSKESKDIYNHINTKAEEIITCTRG
ncbi:MAG: M28 family peptidase [Desulfurococcales archaeon]|nr:M28 family peptidase [Desulfurococcales archaeon]